MKILKYASIIAISLVIANAYSQGRNEQDPDPTYTPLVIPSSPTASELGRYGQIPMNLSSGSLNLNIPIFTYKTKNLSVPISLSYYSNGIKVDQISSWVGMGWSLNAGGVITRTIRDGDDDFEYRPIPPDNLFIGTPDVVDFLNMAADEETYDTEPDLFSFNFNGISGQFVLNRFFEPVLIPYQNIKIETDYADHPQNGIEEITITTQDGVKYYFGGDDVEKSRVIGNSLCGRQTPRPLISSWYLHKIEHPLGDSINFHYGSNQYAYYTGVSQTVQSALNPYAGCSGTNCVGVGSKICEHYVSVLACHLTEISSPDLGKITLISQRDRLDLENMESRLSQILIFDFDNNIIKSFEFIQQFSDNSSSNRMFLDTIKVNDRSGNDIQVYSFEYNKNINDLPERLSFSQDHWGYYNGANNQDFVPYLEDFEDVFNGIGGDRQPNHSFADIGLLTKITYPTKGYNIIEYEPNTYNDDVWVYPDPQHCILDTTYLDEYYHGHIYKSCDEILISYNQEGNIIGNYSYDSTISGLPYDPMHNRGFIKIQDLTTGYYILDAMLNLNNSHIEEEILLIEGHSYSCIIQVDRPGDGINCNFEFRPGLPNLVNMNVPCGGSRVKRVKSYDNIDPNPQIIRYYYANFTDLSKSSGYVNHTPIYYSQQDISYECNYTISTCEFGFLHSSSISNLYEYGPSGITYKKVNVSYGENFEGGGEEYTFKISMDLPGNLIHGSTIAGVSFNNTGWDNAIELSKRTFKNDGYGNYLDVETINNHYKIDNRKSNELQGIVVRKNWTPVITYSDEVICNGFEIKRVYCDANHYHIPIFFKLYPPFTWLPDYAVPWCGAPGGNFNDTITSEITRISCSLEHNHQWMIDNFHPQYGYLPDVKVPWCIGGNFNDTVWSICHNNLGDTITITPPLTNFDVTEYSIFSKWHYIDSVTTYHYNDSGLNPIMNVRSYFYDNPEHANLSRSITTDSKGDTIKAYYYYPDDYPNCADFNALLEKDISGVPIDTRHYLNDRLIEGKVVKYNEFGQPIEAYKAEEELGTDLAFYNNDPYSYGVKIMDFTYDQLNHNLKSTKENGEIITSYEWGYQSQFLISETQNAYYTEVSSTSFEDSEISGWQHPEQVINYAEAHTGGKVALVYSGNGTGFGPTKDISISPISEPTSGYKASVWIKSTSTEPYLHIEIKDQWSTHVRSNCSGSGNWELLTVELPKETVDQYASGNNQVRVYVGNSSGVYAYFDDIRIHPSDASMKTITYDPLIGVTSISAATNLPTFYEYDGFGRVKLIRDSDKNILQLYEYHYVDE